MSLVEVHIFTNPYPNVSEVVYYENNPMTFQFYDTTSTQQRFLISKCTQQTMSSPYRNSISSPLEKFSLGKELKFEISPGHFTSMK